MSEHCCATPHLLPPLPPGSRVRHDGSGRLLEAVARTGTLVTLLALIVVGTAVGGSLGNATTAERPTVTVTYDR